MVLIVRYGELNISIIRNRSEIDLSKLQKLFKERGHGVIESGFWFEIEIAIDHPELIVFQCDCGELVITNEYTYETFKIKGVPKCKQCGNYQELTTPKEIFRIVDDLLELQRKFQENIGNSSERNKIIAKALNLANGLFPTSTTSDLWYFLNLFQYNTEPKFPQVEQYLSEFETLIEKAMKISNHDTLKIFDLFEIEKFNKKMRSFYVQQENYRKLVDKKIISEIDVNPSYLFGSKTSDKPEEILIRMLISSYRSLLENTYVLEFVVNLGLVLQNKEPFKEPFKKLKLTTKTGKKKRIRGIYDMIMYISKINQLDPLNQEIKEIYDTRLRNDDAHVQFSIDIEKKVVKSDYYNEEKTFKEIRILHGKLHSFISALLKLQFVYTPKFDQLFITNGVETMELDFTDGPIWRIYQFIYFNDKIEILSDECIIELDKEERLLKFKYGYFEENCQLTETLAQWTAIANQYQEFIFEIVKIAPNLSLYEDQDTSKIEIDDFTFLDKGRNSVIVSFDISSWNNNKTEDLS